MPDSFLHGIEIVEVTDGARPVRTVRSSVIGVVGTAPDADADKFPLNTPVLLAGQKSESAGIGATGTLPAALDGIFDQAGAVVVMVRVAEGADDAATLVNVIGGVDSGTGAYQGVHAFLGAQSIVHQTPRILIAPGFTHEAAAVTELVSIADRLRAVVIADGPNTNDAAAITYRGNFASDRLYIVDPAVKVFDTVTKAEVIRPASDRVAGLLAKSDDERGFWWSPSNREIAGITGTARAVSWGHGDQNSRANLLNEDEVATIIHEKGYRLWGNRTCSTDPKCAFLSVRRTADMIGDSIQAAHLWAVDRNINRTYLEDVLESVNNYLSHLRAIGAIIDGKAWADPALNTPDQISQGKVTIDFDFSANYPAEHLTFRSHLVDDYLNQVLPVAS